MARLLTRASICIERTRSALPGYTVYVRLVCLANGYVDRWVSMKPAAGVQPGELQIRIVMRETEEVALAVLTQQPEQNVQPNEMSRTEGCDCDVCDPDHVNSVKNQPLKLAFHERLALAAVSGCCVIS